jgi:hypothetical protein
MDSPNSLLTPELSFTYIQIFEKKTCKVFVIEFDCFLGCESPSHPALKIIESARVSPQVELVPPPAWLSVIINTKRPDIDVSLPRSVQ